MEPLEVVHHREARLLELEWEGGPRVRFPAAYLRGWCPCAVCQGHGVQTRYRAPSDSEVSIEKIWTVGAYALGIAFADGHGEGIYRWGYLRALAPVDGKWRYGHFQQDVYIDVP